ncbi:MAG TPA: T9SS type A sorting domain-containing protein [Lutibacter sp.]|nr:T9SS type A sorting domain-containing protein [Lutibacter sp.]
MKKLLLFITFLLVTIIGFSQAGDILYVHTATTANISGNATYLDHPLLNGNANAKIFVAHNLNGDGSVTRSDHVIGVYYDGSIWMIFNEDSSSMIESSSYNVYLEGIQAKTMIVEADGTSYKTVIDHVDLNGNPNAKPIITNNHTPNYVWNDNNYGVYYNTTTDKWYIYNEDTDTNIPANASFNVLIEPALVSYDTNISFIHQATAANQDATDATKIDHPYLNNNPDAYFVMTHNWGAAGYSGSGVFANHTYGTYYSPPINKWVIFTEEAGVAVPLGATFNIAVQIPAPANDEPNNSILVSVLTVGSSCTAPTVMTNVGATSSSPISGDPSCGNYEGGDIWYHFIAPATGAVKIKRTNDGNWDGLKYAVMSDYTTEVSCGTITVVGDLESNVITGLTPGVSYSIRFWEWNNNDLGTEGFCVIAVDTSGIADAVIDGFSMYPNPVKDVLTIETTNPVDAVSIYNMLGQEVINTTKTQIDMSALPAGSYVVKVQAGEQIGAYNLIKQ